MQFAYRLADLNPRCGDAIIRYDDGCNCFYKLKNWDELEMAYMNSISGKYCHEVIQDGPQRFHLDIDGTDEYAIHNINSIISTIYTNLCRLYIKNNLIPSFVVYTTKGIKLSCHIVDLNYHVANSIECKRMATALLEVLPIRIHSYIDIALYKRIHSLRLPYSCKPNINIPKLQIYPTRWIPFRDCLVGSIGSTTLIRSFPIKTEIVDKKMYTGYCSFSLENFSLRDIGGNTVLLDRIRPSYCISCNRVHSSENAYLIMRSSGMYFVCFRNPSNEIFICN